MEWVSKNKVKERMKPLREAFKELNQSNRGYKVQERLVGSAKRNLVLRHHNKGFDCDVDILVTSCIENCTVEEIRKDIIYFLTKKLTAIGYKGPNEKVRSFSYKKIKDGEIEHSFDLIIMVWDEDDECYHSFNKSKDNKYSLGKMRESGNYYDKQNYIDDNNLKDDLRQLYKDKKEKYINQKSKKSFSIYCDCLNELTLTI